MTNINLVFNFPLAGGQARQPHMDPDQMHEAQEEQAQQQNQKPSRN